MTDKHLITHRMKKKARLILIATHRQEELALLSEIIKRGGYAVGSVTEAGDLLKAVKNKKPEVIFADSRMSDFDDPDFHNKIKGLASGKTIPLILIIDEKFETGWAENWPGSVDYIRRPFSATEIMTRITFHIQFRNIVMERDRYAESSGIITAQAERLYKAKNEMIRKIGHDIRNPLTGLIGITDLLLSDQEHSPEMKTRMFSMIKKSGLEIMDLVSEILEFNERTNSAILLNFHDTDLKKMLRKVVKSKKKEAKSKSVDLNLEIDDGIPAISIDEDKIESAFDTLISNALTLAGENGEVNVRAKEINKKGNYIEIVIEDSGNNLSDNEMNLLFDDHQQNRVNGESNTKNGLNDFNTIKRYIESHDGNIRIDAGVPRGTKFTIQLPYGKD